MAKNSNTPVNNQEHVQVEPFVNYRNRSKIKRKRIITEHPDRYRLSTTAVYDETLGRTIQKSEYIKVDRKEEMSKFQVNDFALENLLSVGAPLRPMTMSLDSISTVDNLSATLSSINPSTNE